jgi:hypothetical protein
MDDKDSMRFAEVMTGIADYYGKELSKGTIRLYWEGLRVFDLAAVERALWEHTRNPDNGQFMPKIADVVRILSGRTDDQAARAWATFDAAVRQVGLYGDVVFDDPTIHCAVQDMGGWIAFSRKTEAEWPFVAKEFQNRYRGFRLSNNLPEYPAVLTGISNASNALLGHAIAPPTLIGDSDTARRVMLGGVCGPMLKITRASEPLPSQKQIPASEREQAWA